MLDVSDVAPLADGIGDVGELAPASLLGGPGRPHHASVEADPAGHREIALLAVDGEMPDVDPTTVAVHQHVHRAVKPVRDPDVARREVAGAFGDDPKRDLRLGEDADHTDSFRSVATTCSIWIDRTDEMARSAGSRDTAPASPTGCPAAACI